MASGEDLHDGAEDPLYEAAAGWVARLSSADARPADHEAFAAWCRESPDHAPAYAEMRELWHKLGQVPHPRRRRVPRGTLCLIAAGLIAGLTSQQLGLFDRLRADLWSDVGEIARASLSDGSRVDLNTDTALALRFTERERGVELLRGEASFEVVPDSGRPFVVRGNGLSVRAVGTRFFVRVDGAEIPVGVAQGRVEVGTADTHVPVSAGEAVKAGGSGGLVVVKADVERDMAWRDNRLVFSGQPLSSVLRELARYRRGRIVLLDAKLGQRKVTGAFDPHRTDEALAALEATLGAQVRRLTPLLVLVGSPL